MATLAFLGKDVSCLCASEFLRQRNENDFRFLFQAFGPDINNKVNYHSMSSLKVYLNSFNKHGKKLEMIINNSKDKLFFNQNQTERKNNYLIIDDAEYLFSKEYQTDVNTL